MKRSFLFLALMLGVSAVMSQSGYQFQMLTEEYSEFSNGVSLTNGDYWDDIDEDIHISSFFDSVEPNMNNPVADVFHRFPQLNVSEVARTMGINKSLLSRYIYGIKKPSQQRLDQIMNTIREIGQQMASI